MIDAPPLAARFSQRRVDNLPPSTPYPFNLLILSSILALDYPPNGMSKEVQQAASEWDWARWNPTMHANLLPAADKEAVMINLPLLHRSSNRPLHLLPRAGRGGAHLYTGPSAQLKYYCKRRTTRVYVGVG